MSGKPAKAVERSPRPAATLRDSPTQREAQAPRPDELRNAQYAMSNAAIATNQPDAFDAHTMRLSQSPSAPAAPTPPGVSNAVVAASRADEVTNAGRQPNPRGSTKDRNEVMRREVSEVTSERGIQARHSSDGPVLLVPRSTPTAPIRQQKALPKSPVSAAGRGRAPSRETPKKREGVSAKGLHGRPVAHGADGTRAHHGHVEELKGTHGPDAQVEGATKQKLQLPTPVLRANERSALLPARPPTLAEFESELQFPDDLGARRARVGEMLQSLRTYAAREKRGLAAEDATAKATIITDATAASAAIRGLFLQERAAIHRAFVHAKATLDSGHAQQRKRISADVDRDVGSVQNASSAASVAAAERGQNTNTALHTFAQEQSREPDAIVRAEGQRASNELEQAARECEIAGEQEAARHPGDEDKAPDQREAAIDVGSQSAADVRDKKQSISEDLAERTEEFSGEHLRYANEVGLQIAEGVTQLLEGLHATRDRSAAATRETAAGADEAIGQRHRADIAAVGRAETSLQDRLHHAEQAVLGQLKRQSQRACLQTDAAADALTALIDGTVQETVAAASTEEVPSLAGMSDMIAHARLQTQAVGKTGAPQLGTLAKDAETTFAATVAAFRDSSAQIVHAMTSVTARIKAANATSAERMLQARSRQALEILTSLRVSQSEMATGVWKEIDRCNAEARQKILDINVQFRSDVHTAADESIDKAKKPRTDDVETRAAEAAERAGESWVWGLLRAVGEIVKGFIILVVVALVVAAVAAAFGVLLTAWGAIMIAGAALLAVGLLLAIVHRAGQAQLGGNPFAIVGLALLDTVGVTGVIESIRGRDIVTGRHLSRSERTERGVLGFVSIISLGLGVRAAVKAPPGGVFRPGSLRWVGFGEFFGGWVGRRNLVPALRRGGGDFAVEIYGGLRQSTLDIRSWLARKLSRPAELPSTTRPPSPPTPPERTSTPTEPTSELLAQQQKPPEPHPTLPEPAPTAYDPLQRTDAELTLDTDPAPRAGETGPESAERSRLAKQEQVRRAEAIFESLGERPRTINIEAEEPLHMDDAHTMERHGPEIPLRRADNPGGRTIEGRIHGDPPWLKAENASARWFDRSVMNRTINEYIARNWNNIRADLAIDGRHSAAFDAGHAIGEGFVNEGMYGTGARNAVYSVTSRVRITIVRDPGTPPGFHVVTSFPNLLCLPP
jgi:hypothetical protein